MESFVGRGGEFCTEGGKFFKQGVESFEGRGGKF